MFSTRPSCEGTTTPAPPSRPLLRFINHLDTSLIDGNPQRSVRIAESMTAAKPVIEERRAMGYAIETLAELRHLRRPWKTGSRHQRRDPALSLGSLGRESGNGAAH